MNSIHVKIEQEEALAIKKNSLMIEKELLETITHIQNYNSLRKREFALKIQMKKDLAFIESNLNNIEQELPINEINLIKRQSPKHQTTQIIRPVHTIEKKQTDLERELSDIKRRLAMLG